MKINGLQPHNVYVSFSKEEKEKKTVKEPSGQAGSSDRVEISAEAAGRSEAERLAQKITDTPADTGRAERLDAIKKQVQDGTYQVPAEQVAGSILGGRVDRQV